MSANPALKRPLKLIFLGAPGAGKGTYASRLQKQWNLPHISTGDTIREEIKKGTTLGKQCQDFSSKGFLVPDGIVTGIAKKRLQDDDCRDGWILDGFPRTIAQAEMLLQFENPSLCVNIFLPDKYLIMKLSGRRVCDDCGANYNVADIREDIYDMPPLLPKVEDCNRCKGKPKLSHREDDMETVVKKRLEVYKEETAPLLDFFSSKNMLLNFHVKKGVKDLPDLAKKIINELQ